jgi:hypothetical protein
MPTQAADQSAELPTAPMTNHMSWRDSPTSEHQRLLTLGGLAKMTYRLPLIWGLLMALPSAGLPAARGADALPAESATAIAEDSSSWKRSDRGIVDIRFKKPDGVVFTDQAEEAAPPAGAAAPAAKPAAVPSTAASPAAVIAPAAAPAASPASIREAPIQPQAAAAPAALAAAPIAAIAAAPAATPIATAAPVTTPAIIPAIQPPPTAAPATTPEASAPAPTTSTPHADDQIRLVAQLLMDQGVIRAAQEEPLPPAPTNGAANGRVAPNNGNQMSHGADAIGPTSDLGECCDDSCNCCPPPPCLFWVGGVEATFLVPDLNNVPASFAVEEIAEDRIDFCSTETSDVDSMYLSPRIWLGVQGCCWGANLRYWHLQAGEGAYDPSIGGQGTWDDYDCGRPDFGFFTCNRLEAYTIDLELTRRFCIHDCWMQAALGVRHADIENNESITGLALTNEGILNGFARSNRQSRGTGLLLGLYGRKPLFPCSCVNWFYNARWSALWGPTATSAETFAAVQSSDPDFVATAGSVNGAYTTVDDTLFIGEIQLGLEWNYALCCLPANAFFRLAIEYQRWDGGMGESAADSFAGISIDDGEPATSVVSTSAFAQEPQMDLLGFTIGTGLTW